MRQYCNCALALFEFINYIFSIGIKLRINRVSESISPAGAVSLKLIGINDKDRLKFESILSIAEHRLDVPWQIAAEEKIDFYLVSHRLRPQMSQNSMLKSLPRKKCIFYTTEETDSQENELLISGNSLPSLRSLVLLFNSLSATLNVFEELTESSEKKLAPSLNKSLASGSTEVFKYQKKTDVVDTTIDSAAAPISLSGISYFDPELGFVGLLLSGKPVIYRFILETDRKSVTLYVNLVEKIYYSDSKLEELSPFFTCDVQSKAGIITEQILQNETSEQGLKQQPLSGLIWYAVFSQSNGRVRKGHLESDIVHLKRWPDINLPGCRDLISLAAYMQSNAADLSMAQKKTRLSMQQINNFYNACHAIGLVVHTKQQDIHDKNLNNEKRELFAQIGKRLNKVNGP